MFNICPIYIYFYHMQNVHIVNEIVKTVNQNMLLKDKHQIERISKRKTFRENRQLICIYFGKRSRL